MLRKIGLISFVLLLVACGAEIPKSTSQAIAENGPTNATIVTQNTSIPLLPTNPMPTAVPTIQEPVQATAIEPSPTVELAQREPIQLALNLAPNQIIRYQNNLIYDRIQVSGATSQTVTISMTNDLRYEVLTVNEQEIRMRLVLERLQLKQSLGAMSFGFDTAAPTQDPLTAKYGIFSAIIEQPITLTLKPHGAIAKVEGLDHLVDLMQAVSLGDRELQALVYTNALELYLLNPNLIVYSEQPVAVYDTWQGIKPITIEALSFVVTSTYQLSSYTAEQATLAVNGTIGNIGLSVADIAAERGMGMQFQTDPTQASTQTGTIIIDRQTGLIGSSMLDHMVFSNIMLPNMPADIGGFPQIDRLRIITQRQP